MSIGVAIVGSGIFAKTEHLPAVQATPALSLKAVYSRSIKSAESFGVPDISLYADDAGAGKAYADLLARPDVQGVIIALPILVQPEYIKKALDAGKHVLAEKPIAKDVATAEDLVNYYKASTMGATFGIAENFRFLESHIYAAEKIKELGRVLGFNVKQHGFVKPGTKYFETAWRKTPEYQGGFLLDGGIHSVAAIRLLLGPGNQPKRLSAYSSQLQEHLPPVDSVDSVWSIESGAHGIFNMSFGTTFKASEFAVATENGTVTVTRSKVTVVKAEDEGKASAGEGDNTKNFPDEEYGVKQEMKAWAEGVQSGKQHPSLSPEEGLKDLRVLEAMLRSGESKGTPLDVSL